MLRFVLMRWGFLPGWVKDPKDFPLVINVRSETAAEKPSFRNALKRRRCLMPADGFYEWRRVGRDNQAFLFRKADRGPFAFAAIHETWSGPDGGEIDTVALVNTQANATMAPIHHRCPIVLARDEHEAWLDPQASPADVARLMRPPPDDLLEAVRIGPAVNKVANDGPELQLPFVEPPPGAARRRRPRASPARRPRRPPVRAACCDAFSSRVRGRQG